MTLRRVSFVAALWWLLGSLCLGILLLAVAPRMARPSASENRMLAGFPELSGEALLDGSFFSGIEDFLSDGFFGRRTAVSLTKSALGAFDLRSEEERLVAETAETDRLLRLDAECADPNVVLWNEETEEEWENGFSFLHLLLSAASAEEAGTRRKEPTLTICYPDGEEKLIYSYPQENIRAFADTLDTLRSLLPEDGEVHYLQVPVASVGRRVMSSQRGASWKSTMEDALAEAVGEGVYIHNAPAILNNALMRGERCYFYSDPHWTELGAWYCAATVAESRGYPALPYEETAYDSHFMERKNGREDTVRTLIPLLPTHSYILTHRTEEMEIPFMNRQVGSYTAYINNTRLPWRRFSGGFGTGRRALLLSDSFGNAFLPYLLPYYGEVHMTDLRLSYYDPKEAGGTFRELLALHEIDDVYVLYSTSNGVNSGHSLGTLPKQIAQ